MLNNKYVFVTEKLNLYYGDHQALIDVNIKILRNKITALIGPSGCGKSTLIRSLNRMNDIIEGCKITGKVNFNNRNIYDPDVDVMDLRKKVGMIFQKPNPFPMSVYDNVAYGPRIHGIRDKTELDTIVKNSIKLSALWDEVKDRLKESALGLSGGQQQRVCIARALAVKPKVILMDEPTSALDPIATAKIENLMYKLKKNYTVIIVTHNMQQAGRISDYTGFMYIGKLIEFGETEQIFKSPRNKLTEKYITGRFG